MLPSIPSVASLASQNQVTQAPLRHTIVNNIAAAERVRQPAKQIELYENILSTPGLERALSQNEIADIHRNKALAHTTESDRFFNDLRQPVSALRNQHAAVHHMAQALARYEIADHRNQASCLLAEMDANQSKILEHLQKLIEIPPVGNANSSPTLPETEVKTYQSGRHRHKFYYA